MHFARVESSRPLQKLLAVLERGGWWSTMELTEAARMPSASTRISELRRNGYVIQRRLRPTNRQVHEYRLVGKSSILDESSDSCMNRPVAPLKPRPAEPPPPPSPDPEPPALPMAARAPAEVDDQIPFELEMQQEEEQA